jgi:hypothetical protein
MAKGKKTGGRVPGSVNKSTRLFRELMAEQDILIEVELANAIRSRDLDLIDALTKLLPYLAPKLKEQEKPAEPTATETEQPTIQDLSNEDLLKLLDKATEPDSAPPTRSYN